MDKVVMNTMGGLIIMVMGLICSVFYKKLAYKTAEFYYKLLHIHFSEKGYQIGFFSTGVILVIFGLLSLLQIIEFK
jgi:ABC-type antimicrobial peptide transport system permease subunit